MSALAKGAIGMMAIPAAGVLALGALVSGGAANGSPADQTGTHSGSCQVTVDGAATYQLDAEQVDDAATIDSVRASLGMPVYATTVALAASLQESSLHNLHYGDRDSEGLFQERPSEGWGTPEQVTDPVYASTQFLTRLAGVAQWQTIPITQAAQAVEISGFPDAYAQWEDEALALTRAVAGVTGNPQVIIACAGGRTLTSTTTATPSPSASP